MTKKVNTNERKNNGNRYDIGMTEVIEVFMVGWVPGVRIEHNGARSGSDVYTRKYILPEQNSYGALLKDTVISFVYNRRDGWAEINISRADIGDMKNAFISDVIDNILEVKLGDGVKEKAREVVAAADPGYPF